MLKARPEQAPARNWAETDPWSDDPRLLGRTYAIPFDVVWRACLELVTNRGRWVLLHSNDLVGVIGVRCTTRSLKGRHDFGTNTRRIGRFLLRLDKHLGAGRGTIIDPKDAVELASGGG